MSAIHVILHPTDFSPSSEQAFRTACSLARDQNARLIVLHVLDRPIITYTGVAMAPPAPPPIEVRIKVQEELNQLQIPPGLAVEKRLEEGDPATGILQVAEEMKCDLIVMGTHGRTGLMRLLLGSVAEKVLRAATCPVLTVKAPAPMDQQKQ